MPSVWMPGARVIQASVDGGTYEGGPKKVVWHTVEAPYTAKPSDMAAYMNRMGYSVHLCWNPVTGEIVQMIPANKAGRGLENRSGGVQTNRGGSVVIQIEVVAQASDPFTKTACKNLDKIMDWLRSWGIPDVFPAGSPGGSESYGPNSQRTVTNWSKSGHFGHSQVPENSHWDPGKIDINKILSAGTKQTPAPAPKPSGGYVVKAGDTLWELSLAWKVSVSAIKSANGLKTDDLDIGQKLVIPGVSKPKVPVFPGTQYFRVGSNNKYVTQLDNALIKAGLAKYSAGDKYTAGPNYTEWTKKNVQAFQKSLGWTGSDADGLVGPSTWREIFKRAGYVL